jgi:hypothetical protein
MNRKEENKQSNLFIDIFDINGHSINLHLFGKEKYKTFIGSLSGLLSVMMMLAISIYFIRGLFDKKPLSIVFNEDVSQLPINNMSNVPLMVLLGDLSSNALDPEGLYWIDAKVLNYRRIKENGTSKFTLDVIPIQLEKCDINKHFLNQTEIYKNFPVSKYQCIPPGKYNITLYGRYGDTLNGWSMLGFFLNKCNSKIGQKCHNDTYMNNVLANTGLSIAYTSYSIDHYNVIQPNVIKVDTAMFLMSSTLAKSYYYKLRQVIYETDYGILFEDRGRETFYTYLSQSIDVSLQAVGMPTLGPNIGSVLFINADAISFYNRHYLKVQAVIANVGGIIKAIMVICKFISDFLTRKMLHLDIVNRIFYFNLNQVSFLNSILTNKTNKTNPNFEENNCVNLPIENKSYKDNSNIYNISDPRSLSQRSHKSR